MEKNKSLRAKISIVIFIINIILIIMCEATMDWSVICAFIMSILGQILAKKSLKKENALNCAMAGIVLNVLIMIIIIIRLIALIIMAHSYS